MAFIAANADTMVSTRQIAETFNASEAHMSKVLQRLTKAGFINSTRGPKGGFYLKDGWEKITLLDIYEMIEGPVDNNDCIFDEPVCDQTNCIMDGAVADVNNIVLEYFRKTNLFSLAATCKTKLTISGKEPVRV